MQLIVLLVLLFTQSAFVLADEPLFSHLSKKQEEALVVKVVDSDCIVLENGHRVKFIGISSIGLPAKKYVERDNNGVIIEEEPDNSISLEEEALTFAQQLLENKKVHLEYDVERRSLDGYEYAYVYLPDGTLANAELLRMGFVQLSISPPNVKYADKLRAAYQEAREQKRGILGE